LKFFSRLLQKLHTFSSKGSTGSVFKNMTILASGSAMAKVIGLGTYPVITRLYTPEDFGVLAVFTSALGILVPLATLRYSETIPLPKHDGLAFNVLLLGILLIALMVSLMSILFSTIGVTIFGFFNMEIIAQYWWLLILGIAGAGMYELLSKWATRQKKFAPVAKTTIWQSSLSAFVKIGLGYMGVKPLGLLIGDVVSKGGGVLSLFQSFRKDLKENAKHYSRKKILFLLKYYKDLPLFRLPSQFLLVFSIKMPILFFAFQFGSDVTGQLGLALVVVGIPMGLIGRSTGKAYYAEIAKLGNNKKEEILALTKSITKRLSLLSLLPTLVLLLFSPLLFQFIFGVEWEQAGVFTSILAFYLFIQFITSPLVNVFNVFNRQRKYLEINIVRTLLIAVVFGASYFLGYDVYTTLVLYTIIISGHYMFTGYQVYKVIK
jgi:O-antigen/teichoic acid export membrane protein